MKGVQKMANGKRLISDDAFKKAFYVDDDCDEIRFGVDGKVFVDFKAVQRAIDEAPTVDAVEVCRCKDCKHYKARYERCDHPKQEWIYCVADLWLEMKPDDFCSYGERREGE